MATIDVAMESTSQEILTKMSGMGDKTYTITTGSVSANTSWSATGRGIIYVAGFAGYAATNFNIDGVSIEDYAMHGFGKGKQSGSYEIRFCKSVSFKAHQNQPAYYVLYLED